MSDTIIEERVEGVGKRLYNQPFTKKDNSGMSYRPTRMKLPSWVSEETMTEGVANFEAPSANEFSVERVSSARPRSVLENSPMFPNVSKAFDSVNLLDEFAEMAPEDGVEISGWMHESAADAAVMSGWAKEYGKHSEVVTNTGDGNIPGVAVQDLSFQEVSGYTVASQGHATAQTPVGSFDVPDNGGLTMIGSDILSWGGVSGSGSYQWSGKLAQYTELASTPINNTVRFPQFGGSAAPNIMNQQPSDSTQTAVVSFDVSAYDDSELDIVFRDPNDYTNVLDESAVSINEGTSTVSFTVASYPEVPPVVSEIAPSDATGDVQSIESYTVEGQ